MNQKEYESYIDSVIDDWDIGDMTIMFSASGLVEEVKEFLDTLKTGKDYEILAEAGDVIFYTHCLLGVFNRTYPKTDVINGEVMYLDRLLDTALKIMKDVSKKSFFGGRISIPLATKMIKDIQKTIEANVLICNKNATMETIMCCNVDKLKQRYPNGRSTTFMKDVVKENEIIRNRLKQ